jgi:hypothetical protein
MNMPFIGTYRTESGRYYFRWLFEEQSDDEVRIYILHQPPYRGRDEGAHETHRYGLGSGRPYICYEPPPDNLTDAIEVAKAWAERTEEYIEWGTPF